MATKLEEGEGKAFVDGPCQKQIFFVAASLKDDKWFFVLHKKSNSTLLRVLPLFYVNHNN